MCVPLYMCVPVCLSDKTHVSKRRQAAPLIDDVDSAKLRQKSTHTQYTYPLCDNESRRLLYFCIRGTSAEKKICQVGTFDNFHFFMLCGCRCMCVWVQPSYECIIVFDVSHSRNTPIRISLSHLVSCVWVELAAFATLMIITHITHILYVFKWMNIYFRD